MVYSPASNSALDQAIDDEDAIHHDILRLVWRYSPNTELHQFFPLC